MNERHIAMFVRPPVVGRVKTRLASFLGADSATALYRAFVEDTSSIVQRLNGVSVTVWSAGPPTDEVDQWALTLGADLREQPRGGLGVRLEAAFEHGLRVAKHVVAIGSDAPTLPTAYLASVFGLLNEAAVVLGPVADGGYFAIGASGRAPVLNDIRWSSRHTLIDTVQANHGRSILQTSPWYDVDTPADLYLLHAHLSLDPASAPSTHRAMQPFSRSIRECRPGALTLQGSPR